MYSKGPEERKRILVVDDDAQVRTLFCHIFSVCGYFPVGAADCEEATNLLLCNDFDLITLDVYMPCLSGAQVHKIWTEEFGRGRIPGRVGCRRLPPILLITGYAEDAFQSGLAFGEGIVGVVQKPVSAERLIRIVENIFEYERANGESIGAAPVPAGASDHAKAEGDAAGEDEALFSQGGTGGRAGSNDG
ncbi:MAG: response regulator [Planctomycetota bacterium]|nr:response regulator [Planctomycetota bacterium]